MIENTLGWERLCIIVVTEQGPWSQAVQIPILTLPLTGSVTLGKLLTINASISSTVKQR